MVGVYCLPCTGAFAQFKCICKGCIVNVLTTIFPAFLVDSVFDVSHDDSILSLGLGLFGIWNGFTA